MLSPTQTCHLFYFLLAFLSFSVTALRSFAPNRISFNRAFFLCDQLGRVTMYSKETCPYCKKAKSLLEEKYQLEIACVDIENADQTKREEIISQMRNFSGGRNTVPQIFFNSDHLGGNDDVQKLDQEGKLSEMVERVKKTPVSMMMDHWYHPWY